MTDTTNCENLLENLKAANLQITIKAVMQYNAKVALPPLPHLHLPRLPVPVVYYYYRLRGVPHQNL